MDPAVIGVGVMVGVGAAVLAFWWLVPASRWGRVRRDALDEGRFQETGSALGLALTWVPSARRASLAGAWEQRTVRISYEWHIDPHEVASVRPRAAVVRTTLELPLRGLPEGLVVRDRSLVDVLGGGERLALEDPELAAAFFAEGPADDVAACLARPGVGEALLALRSFAPVEIDSTRLALVVPSLLVEAAVLGTLLDAMVRVAGALGAGSAAPVVAAGPAVVPRIPTVERPSAKPLRPSLSGLVRGAHRGVDLRAASRAADELVSRPCFFELEVQRVTTETGVGDGVGTVTLHGIVARGTSRVGARFPGDLGLLARAYGPGEHVTCEGYIEHYDFLSDHVEVTCDAAPVALGGALPAMLPADLPLTGVIARLHAQAALRVSALAGLAGQSYPVSFHMTAVRPSNRYRVPAILQGGVTATGLVDDSAVAVDLRLPEGAPGFVGATITLTVAISGWDEVENRLLLDAVPVG